MNEVLKLSDYKQELMEITYLSEKHIENYFTYIVKRMETFQIDLNDLVQLYLNERYNGTVLEFSKNFNGVFDLSTFKTLMDLLEYKYANNN